MPLPRVVAEPTTAELEAGFAAIRAELRVPEQFPPEVVAEAARRVAQQASEAERADRRDLPLVTIDPPGSRDLDQALHIESRVSGYRVWYAIADLGSFVAPGDAVDAEARRRGLTRYSPDRRSPLHPELLSEGAASLLPDVDRPVLLWRFDLDADGRVESTALARGVARSRAALTYEDVQAQLDAGTAAEAMVLLRTVGRLRQGLERDRGAVHLDLPTQQVAAVDGRYELRYRSPVPVEAWNAQISLLTGMEGARIMLDGGFGVLRTMPRPPRRDVAAIRRSARTLGIDWPEGLPYAEVVRSIDPTTPVGAALVTQVARTLRGAGYAAFAGEVPAGPRVRHSAVAAPYAHVTAPLRRLVDRFGNEVLLALVAGREPPDWVVAALPTIPKLMGPARERERVLNRAIVDYVEAMVLRHRNGEVFPVAVTDIDERRAVIQLQDPAVLASISPEGRELGEELEVRLVAADPTGRRITFAPA